MNDESQNSTFIIHISTFIFSITILRLLLLLTFRRKFLIFDFLKNQVEHE